MKNTGEHEIQKGLLLVSLTSDAYDYNDEFYTLEVTKIAGREGGDNENDADISGVRIDAGPEVINAYLGAAMANVQARLARPGSCGINNASSCAALAANQAVFSSGILCAAQ